MVIKDTFETEHITLDIFDEKEDNIRISIFNKNEHFIDEIYLSEFQAKELKELLNKLTFNDNGEDCCI